MEASSAPEMHEPAIVIPPLKDHKATLIFFHGLGDTGHGWAEILEALKFKHIKCVCPHAPTQKVTVNRGMRMPSWFDIHGFEPNSTEDEVSIKEASQTLQALVETEVKNSIPSSLIFIGGISQGGAVALYTAFTVDKPVGGIVALSTWLPLHRTLADDKVPKYNKDVPVLLCHGTEDSLVKYSWGQATSQFIQSFNSNAQFKTYEGMAHAWCLQVCMHMK
ncbi:acyl-protein thioesterase 1-like isoform X2 [Babylonia areolata]|uniref:acyl-protein thioesterase 1-like isoform X2 n=1 Tax=Babylonia areolata TaxID=304850 RepID=UPI003FD60D4C